MKRKQKGFTLLEIIIVVIIVGVLASLALPRLFSTVEYSRSTEALAAIGTIRSSMERCVLQNGKGDYSACDTFGELDVTDPKDAPGAHFTYAVTGAGTGGYTITAKRNTVDGGGATDTIKVAIDTSAKTVTKSGSSAFQAIK